MAEKNVLQALHDWAKEEANRPGAYALAELRDACAREIEATAELAAGGHELVPVAGARELAAFTITEDMLDRAIVASYTAAQPAPSVGTPQERLAAMQAAERAQMRAALIAALEAAPR